MSDWIVKALCLLALMTLSPLAHAQVYHCIGAHGEPVFSGQPCGTPAAATSIAAAAQGSVCAASPQALRQAIAAAFASHDVNKLAGLMLWRDADQASAVATLRTLAEWLKQPLAGIAIAYAAGPPVVGNAPAAGTSTSWQGNAPSLVPQTPSGFEVSTSGADGSTRDFGVVEIAGCWWLAPQS